MGLTMPDAWLPRDADLDHRPVWWHHRPVWCQLVGVENRGVLGRGASRMGQAGGCTAGVAPLQWQCCWPWQREQPARDHLVVTPSDGSDTTIVSHMWAAPA